MADTAIAANNKSVAYGTKLVREPSGAAKKWVMRKNAKRSINRGLVSEKAAARHLKDF